MRKNYWAVKHDMSSSNLYRRWIGIKSRCLNPNNCNYKYYGGRGIGICEEWLNFNSFAEWAMSNGFDESLTIDRIDNDGDYCPSNCRWVTQRIQNINMRHKNTSGYIGICRHSVDGAWYGRLKVNGQYIYTGRSKNIHEAARMRNEYIDVHNLPNRKNVITCTQ